MSGCQHRPGGMLPFVHDGEARCSGLGRALEEPRGWWRLRGGCRVGACGENIEIKI